MPEQTYLPGVGVDAAHWAPLTADPVGGQAEYGTPKRLPGLVQVAYASNSQSGTYWADNGAYATATQLGEQTISVQCADLPPADRAVWYGQKYEGGALQEGAINPIEMAFMFRRTKSNGAFRYFRYVKIKPGVPDDTSATKNNSIAFQDGTVPMAVSQRQSDGIHRQIVDSDDPNLGEGVTPEIIAENWFASATWMPGDDPVVPEV